MTKQEFETIAKRTVTAEQYKAIETLYMNSDLDKYEFVKSIKKTLDTIPEEKDERKKIIVGVKEMPNGTWMVYEAAIINANIRTGLLEVKRLTANRCWAETGFDVYYTRVQEIA